MLESSGTMDSKENLLQYFCSLLYIQIVWEEVAFSWKVTGKAVAISIAPTVHDIAHESYHQK